MSAGLCRSPGRDPGQHFQMQQELRRSKLDKQRVVCAGFRPVPGLKPSSLPVRPGNQGGDTPFQGLVCDDKCQVQVSWTVPHCIQPEINSIHGISLQTADAFRQQGKRLPDLLVLHLHLARTILAAEFV